MSLRRPSVSIPFSAESSKPSAHSSVSAVGVMALLPLWIRGGRPVTIPISRNRQLTIPLAVPLFSLLLLIGYLLLHSTHHGAAYHTLPSSHYRYTSSPMRVDKSQFPSPGDQNPLRRPDYLPAPIPPKESGMVVPNAVHYVYGLKPVKEGEQSEELPYYAYLAIRSALINIKPEKVYFHYEHLPRGPWWDLIEPHLTLIRTQVPHEIYGRPLEHFAHKADVLRLLAMKHSGGIYLDIDMFVVKPFDDLMYFPTTLGMESATSSWRSKLDPEGLCNAVIVSAPESRFIDRWLESYQTYEEGVWAHHSVVMPWHLARDYPDEIQVLNHQAFFWPMWYGSEIEKTHEEDDYDFRATGQYAYHAWESLAMKYLQKLSPHEIREHDNSFNRLVRPFIGPEDDRVYKAWKGDD